MSTHPDHIVVLCSCPDSAVAARVAAATVEAGLAACVNRIDGMTSLFRWQDAVQEEEESLLLLKTRRDVFDRLVETIRDNHPYEIPEIIALPIAIGDGAYLDWIDQNIIDQNIG
jgi:periplasmic divalent cation tolerance protein